MLRLKNLTSDTSGATAFEYTLIAVGISIVIVDGVALVGGSVGGRFDTVANTLTGG